MAESYAPTDRRVRIKIRSWPTDAAMLDDFRHGEPVPDIFMASRRQLSALTQRRLIQPVDQLLDDRGFDFGDEYPRTSLTAFSGDNRLQCLPYDVQPQVVFYNKRLVHFGRIGPNPPQAGQGWSLDQFAAAARWAALHHPGVVGSYLEPSVPGIAPFVYSGGGKVFDNETAPTSLALSDSANLQTLTSTVRVLRPPAGTLSSAQLARRTPLGWFLRGKLAFLEGSRRIVPDLRAQPGLRFDVMPIPSLGTSATVGNLTGMCISATTHNASTAADFLAYANSPGALALVAEGGYLQPANQTVALSDAFQQPQYQPRHAAVFTFSVKSMVYPPSVGESDELEQTVDPLLHDLLEGRPNQVPARARQIDRASYRVLGPKLGPPASPSQSAG
jgi:multiple sugar transport system substrate-binding protein